ncbi:hypothetical protein [Anaerosporobacter sp.]
MSKKEVSKIKKLLKQKLLLKLGISFLFLLSSIIVYNNVLKIHGQQTLDSFSNLLSTHNIIVEGNQTNLTKFQLKGLIDELNPENINAIVKYENKMSNKGNTIVLTAKEILELDYYSKTKREQETILNKITDDTVSIDCKEGVILISYNLDN